MQTITLSLPGLWHHPHLRGLVSWQSQQLGLSLSRHQLVSVVFYLMSSCLKFLVKKTSYNFSQNGKFRKCIQINRIFWRTFSYSASTSLVAGACSRGDERVFSPNSFDLIVRLFRLHDWGLCSEPAFPYTHIQTHAHRYFKLEFAFPWELNRRL